MKLLALDVGRKRTGVAFADTEQDIMFALSTLAHATETELVDQLVPMITERSIDRVVLGLPLLPSGTEGSQSTFVRSIGTMLQAHHIPLAYLDERYTTPKHQQTDGDAAAACELLSNFLSRSREKGV